MKLLPTLTLACFALPSLAAAQTDMMQVARLAGANQVGVMEYCQSQGWADQAAVDAQKTSLAGLPPVADTSGYAAAEATGRSGSLLNNGTALPLASMASQTHTTVQALCGKLADSAKMGMAQRNAMPPMPAMPAFPSGMTMPAMPGMPTMPRTQ